mgnify:FL=1
MAYGDERIEDDGDEGEELPPSSSSEVIRLAPNAGPQEAFLACSADHAWYGGAAGGGKSYAVILDSLRWHADPHFGGIIFRRQAVDLAGAGSIWEEAEGIFPRFGADMRQSSPREASFPSGATITFDHLQHEGDKFSHQGKQYSAIYFEELTHFSESQYWYLSSRLRTKARVRPYVRATCNPDPDSWVRRFIAWWIGPDGYALPERSGVVRYFVRDGDSIAWADTREELVERYRDPDRVRSFTFILSRLRDNPKVDPSYRGQLLSLPTVDRERLLGDEDRGGNWDVRPSAGTFFARRFFRIRDYRPAPQEVRRRVRAWDKAATRPSPESPDPDWTRGALLAELVDGSFVIEHIESLRGTPGEVEAAMKRIAELDGPDVEIATWQDPGQAGLADVDRLRTVLRGRRFHVVRASRSKVDFAKTWQGDAEAGKVALVRGTWNAEALDELDAFPDGRHDDIVDAVSLGFLALFGTKEAVGLRVRNL